MNDRGGSEINEKQGQFAMSAYTGRCHCGAVRFQVELNLAAGTGKCNCSYCGRVRLWFARAAPADYRVEAEKGALSEYQGGNGVAHHFFCARCGNHVYDYVDAPNLTGQPYVNVNPACLENVAVDELLALPVRYFDGLPDAWNETPSETRHLKWFERRRTDAACRERNGDLR